MNPSASKFQSPPTRARVVAGKLRAGVVGLVVGMAAAAGATAWAQGGPGGHGGPGAGLMMAPEMLAGPHGDRALDRLLEGTDATDAQRAQIRQIAQAAAVDMKAQHEAGKALHDRLVQVFTAPTVDANAVEQVRQQMLARHDQASRRASAAMIEISRVLSPDQRLKIADRMKQQAAAMELRRQQRQGKAPADTPTR